MIEAMQKAKFRLERVTWHVHHNLTAQSVFQEYENFIWVDADRHGNHNYYGIRFLICVKGILADNGLNSVILPNSNRKCGNVFQVREQARIT